MDETKERKNASGIRRFLEWRLGRKILVIFELVLVVLYFMQPQLYYDANAPTFFQRFYADSLITCGVLWAVLFFVTIIDFHISEKVNKIISYILIAGTPLAAFFWLEIYNHFQFWEPLNQIPALYLFLDLVLYYATFAIILFLFNNVRNASVCMIIATMCYGIVNYFVASLRGMSLIASDIYSIFTGLSVANTYQIRFDVSTEEFFLLALVMVVLVQKLHGFKLVRWRGRLVFAAGVIAGWIGVVNVYVLSDYLESIGVDYRVYRPQTKYRYFGTLLTTIRTFGYLNAQEPKNYSVAAVEDIIEEFENGTLFEETETGSADVDTTGEARSDGTGTAADTAGTETVTQTLDQQPNVICIMNESFADMASVGDMELTNDYMPYFRSLEENCIKGYAYSSVFGGNTANSEFECMTGNTMAFLPDNSVPYQLFIRSDTAGLTYTLKDQGYSPVYALHPYLNTGYSRYKVYPLLGFDEFFSMDDFPAQTETVNTHITDLENYKKLIELYEETDDDDKPFYIYNVTMQNHGSYNGNVAETGDTVQLEGRFKYESKVEQYLNLIKMSDDALEYLINYFEGVDEPTVIVFFGDHQPDLSDDFFSRLVGKDIDELEGEEQEQLYKVPFLIWANYDIEEQTVERTSFNYLTTYLAEVTGIKTTGYIDFLTQLREEIPCINAIGYWGKDGNFYETDDETSPYYDLIEAYNMLEYNNLFGNDNQITSFFYVGDDH